MKTPIATQLRIKAQVEMAYLQDEMVDIMYSLSNDLILHGGQQYGDAMMEKDSLKI